MIFHQKQINLVTVILFTFLITHIHAQTTKATMADAQRAYVAGEWKKAAEAYEVVCPSQPKETQVSCNLWGILALSQAGDAKSFKKAGSKLDSLINTTNPQHENYADLIMTRAQFMLYLGKYEKAAEDLIHAIETSRPEQNLVLQKVCTAVRSKSTSADLAERCDELKDTSRTVKVASSSSTIIASSSSTIAANSSSAEASSSSVAASSSSSTTPQSSSSEMTTPPQPASSSVSVTASSSSSAEAAPTEPVAASSSTDSFDLPEVKPAPVASTSSTSPHWTLQLGAFGVKSNANLLVSNLKKHKVSCVIEELPRGEKILYMVQTGHFSSKEAANSYGEKTLTPLNVEYQTIYKK